MSEVIKQEHEYEYGHNPDFVDNGTAFGMLDKLHMVETLAEPAQRRELFGQMDDEHYEKFVGYVNARTRGEHPRYEYEDGQLRDGILTPPLAHKSKLMQRTFEAVRDILNDPELDDRDALQVAGLTLAGSINMIHPFKDGNGRTGRVMDYLVQYGTERGREVFQDEMRAIIARTPAYVGEEKKVINDTPDAPITKSLEPLVVQKKQQLLEEGAKISHRGVASLRVKTFLDAMSGKVEVPLLVPMRVAPNAEIQPGEENIVTAYRLQFESTSSAPSHSSASHDEKQPVKLVQRSKEAEDELQRIADSLISEFV